MAICWNTSYFRVTQVSAFLARKKMNSEMIQSNENKGKNTHKKVNQQVSFILRKNGKEKFCYFLAGFFEGEGSLWTSINYQPKSPINIQINMGFSIYQHSSGLPILEAAQHLFKTGRIYLKPGTQDIYVFEINSRKTIKEKVLPFIEKYVLPLGCKFNAKPGGSLGTFDLIKELIDLFDQKKHLEPSEQGIIRCIEIVYATNPLGKGKKRKRSLDQVKDLVRHSKR